MQKQQIKTSAVFINCLQSIKYEMPRYMEIDFLLIRF